jgi:Tfp pilus assembly protein PilF
MRTFIRRSIIIKELIMENKIYNAVAVLVLLLFAVASSGQDTTVLNSVQKMYAMRYKNPGLIDSSIFHLNNYLEKDPKNVKARILLSEIYLKKGDRETENDKKLDLFTKGEEQARLALKQDSANGRALAWEVSNFSMICKTKGIMSSLANIPRIKRGIARALQLDPTFPKAYAAQGIIFIELPGFLGGNLDSAHYYFEKGMALDSNYAGIYVKMAELLILQKDYGKAREYLNKVLVMKNPTDRAEYELVNRSEAEKRLDEIKDR